MNSAVAEALECRQLLSSSPKLTIDVRASDGSSAVNVTAPGQVFTLDVYAVIQGDSTDPSQDGIQDLQGSFVGTNVGFGPVAGDLAAQNVSPFNASGASPGISQDLNGDGNKDVGGTNNLVDTGWFYCRSSSMTTGAFQFELATLTYTVNKINYGGEVDVNFVIRPTTQFTVSAVWLEDGIGYNQLEAPVVSGPPVVITDEAAQPTGPIAVADTSTAVTGAAQTIDVLKNDYVLAGKSYLDSSVTVVTPPSDGGTAVVDDSTGDIVYTSAPTFFGTSTFSYTVEDNDGDVSPPATVTVTVVPPVPTAVNDTAGTLANTPVTVNVLANDASPIGFNASTVTLTTQPTSGTAVVNSDGTITYTPNTGFIGGDSLAYTVQDNNGTVSNIATVTLNVGVEISSAKGGNKSVTYQDVDGTTGVITLNHGVAEVLFSGSGTYTDTKGKVVVTGSSMGVSGIDLSGTNASSTLLVRGTGGSGVVGIGGITDAAVLGHISAAAVNLTGTSNLAAVAVLQFSSALGATVQITGSRGNVAITCGALNNSTITAASDAITLHSGSLTSSTISAQTGKSLRIVGNVATTNLNFSGTLASLKITGGLSSNSAMNLGALGTMNVAGTISGSTMTVTGNIATVIASAMTNDTITAGVTAGTTLATAAPSNLGNTSRIGNIKLTSKTSTFVNSSVLANTITSASLGAVTTGNNGTPTGLAAEQIKSVLLSVSGAVQHLGPKQLVAPGVTFGDFVIELK